MQKSRRHDEAHKVSRSGWLRAAVLGANDGLLSTSSLVLGVAVAGASPPSILLTGIAGLVAGSMSMAAGEYVSVSSQADIEAADLAREAAELRDQPEAEHRELSAIYVRRGVDPALARQVAEQLMATDALAAHARDELGISDVMAARPIQAAMASAGSFAVGAALPLLVVVLAPQSILSASVAVASLVFLGILGATGARAGGADILRPTLRVMFWGVAAMAVTAAVGALFGTRVAG
jgi:VIT1/CCC1 family predicted Fe2+/Mn2+ transporter